MAHVFRVRVWACSRVTSLRSSRCSDRSGIVSFPYAGALLFVLPELGDPVSCWCS